MRIAVLERMKCVAVAIALFAGACNTDGPRRAAMPSADATDDDPAPTNVHAHIAVTVGARDGEPSERFASKEDVFMTAFVTDPLSTDVARDYFFRVVDGSGADVSRSDAACRRVRIGKTGRIEVLYANGDDACPHSSARDRTHGGSGVTVGLAPFGDAAAILDGVASYEVQLAPVERFTGFQDPTFAVQFVLDMQIAAR